ncbi:MAG TPA: invasion associated locus B family protein [Dongiaceae bacterium]|jgi:invasion protein IalB|nr:invasion associated locus B family protein [Dongiaceae bacterium]
MKFKRIMALATLMFLIPGSGALAQNTQPTTNAPAVKPEKFKDWELFCPERKDANAPQVCEIRTVIVSDKGQRLGALVVAAEAGNADSQMIASALLPLGVDLTFQPTLAAGTGKPIALKFLRCLQRGCEAMTALSADQQTVLRAGSQAKVAVGIGAGKTATFDFSLAGFSAAHDALKKRTGAQ